MKKSPLKKKSSRPTKALKDRAWKAFARWVRTRDKDTCFTCGKTATEAGHFRHRANNTYFNPINVHAQCLTKESKLKLSDGSYKEISKIIIGDKLSAFDEINHKPKIATVECVTEFVPKSLYEVLLEDGSKFCSTGDHKVLANGSWVCIKDMLHDVSTYDILEM